MQRRHIPRRVPVRTALAQLHFVRQRLGPRPQTPQDLMHALHERLVAPRRGTAVDVADDVARDARQFDVRDEVRRVGELVALGGRELLHRGQVDVDVVVADGDRVAELGAPDAVHRVDGPPHADAVLALDGRDHVPLGHVVVQAEGEAEPEGDAREGVGRVGTVEGEEEEGLFSCHAVRKYSSLVS